MLRIFCGTNDTSLKSNSAKEKKSSATDKGDRTLVPNGTSTIRLHVRPFAILAINWLT